MNKVDYRQFQCPHPVVETRKQLIGNPEQVLEVLVGDQMAIENISRLAKSMGYGCEQLQLDDGFSLTLSPIEETTPPRNVAITEVKKTVIFCASDQMGEGNAELGNVLMKNFLLTLTEITPPPETILFVNSGVKLACSGSDALEALNKLACSGVDIASCGLCLDFYHLKEQLKVGRATNMLEIAETQLQAERVIRP